MATSRCRKGPDPVRNTSPDGPRRRKKRWLLPVFILSFLSLNAVVLSALDGTVKEPYMDEEFHIPQVQRYCESFRPTVYHPDISTPPGLYWVAALLARSLSPAFAALSSSFSSSFSAAADAAQTLPESDAHDGEATGNVAAPGGRKDDPVVLPVLCRSSFFLRGFNALFVSPLTLLLLWVLARRIHFSLALSEAERTLRDACREAVCASLFASRKDERDAKAIQAFNSREEHGKQEPRSSRSPRLGKTSDAGASRTGRFSPSEAGESESARDAGKDLLLLLRIARIALLPSFYFFNFLFYTDCLAVLLLLFAYHELLSRRHLWGLAAAGVLAFFVRQTAVVWSGGAGLLAFLAALGFCASAREAAKRKGMQRPPRRFPPNAKASCDVKARLECKERAEAAKQANPLFRLCLCPAFLCRLETTSVSPLSVLRWENLQPAFAFFLSPSTFAAVSLPLALPLFTFLLFLLSNGGRVAVGHQAFHAPSVHTAQLLYAALFVASAASPASFLSAFRAVLSLLKSVWLFFCRSLCSLRSPESENEETGKSKRDEAGESVEALEVVEDMERDAESVRDVRSQVLRERDLKASFDADGENSKFCFSSFLAFFLSLSVAAGLGAFAHPFLLSDNRHLAFYLWRYFFRWPIFRWIIGPLVAALFFVGGDVLSSLVAPPAPRWLCPPAKARAAGERRDEETVDGRNQRGAVAPGPASFKEQTLAERSRPFYVAACLFTFLVCSCLALVPTSLVEPRYFSFTLLLFVLHERFPSSRPSGEGEKPTCGWGLEASAGCMYTREASPPATFAKETFVDQRARSSRAAWRGVVAVTNLEERQTGQTPRDGEKGRRPVDPNGAGKVTKNAFSNLFSCLFSRECWVNLYSGKNLGPREDLANEAAALVLNFGLSFVVFYVFLCRSFIDSAGRVARFMV
ncbi:hypothetical protein TGME49_263690 [Toxoplasma gondii ME49]|uniref:Dol-P-Glc:Glc(2)Man(9)GlcNAc(2)-PP-Dol alpha-1,2-glucosyltransferase n=2 Tax=Toxoplasma gondii TaxID=5811 RepID=S8GD98_TOXGM|nr:hypothetical protein TGME49_263690 [Toxoplasma gondii ME49]EPT29770.1 hypothetical protein TGME49_263690 [Toxoplasma gondii ME49]|eukprot:XP_002365469.1 hypothetical protein TGME49_263690 [Toxoplasma gondii ME49]